MPRNDLPNDPHDPDICRLNQELLEYLSPDYLDDVDWADIYTSPDENKPDLDRIKRSIEQTLRREHLSDDFTFLIGYIKQS